MNEVNKDLSHYTYRCKYCDMECIKTPLKESGLGTTKLGNYGSAGTPTPESYVEEMYEATTISFTAASGDDPAYISDANAKFVENMIIGGSSLRIETTSGTNDGDYTAAVRQETPHEKILLDDDDSLTTESAATAGTVTISRIIYKPLETGTGCPFCQSLNSK